MPPVITIDSFLEAVTKSKLLDANRLESYLQVLREQNAVPETPTALAMTMVQEGLLTGFQARLLLQGKPVGLILVNKYKVLDLLGTGGSGKVFLCEHMMLKRPVAVKILPPEAMESTSAVERFHREARSLAALDHPNIVRVFDFDRANKLHFMVMEYVDGSSLYQIVTKHGPMETTRAAHYVSQVAIGLHHAFQAGWVHRDIKPSNLLLDRTGTMKILDLGLARMFGDSNDRLTQQYDNKSVLGTADYIAPEQAVSSHQVDIRADIYSLGATFFYLLAGHPPFQDGTIHQKLIWHQMRTPDLLTVFRTDIPVELAQIVARMLAKNPDDRYQTPADLVEALLPWTRTPIATPLAEEMPQLSPALMQLGLGGPGASQASTVTGLDTLGTPKTGPVTPIPEKSPSFTTPYSPANPITGITGKYARPTGNSGKLANSPGAPPSSSGTSPPTSTPSSTWNTLSAAAPTNPAEPSSLVSRPSASWTKPALLGLVALALLGGGTTAAYLFLSGDKGTDVAGTPSAPVRTDLPAASSALPDRKDPPRKSVDIFESSGRKTMVVSNDADLKKAYGHRILPTLKEAISALQTDLDSNTVIRVVITDATLMDAQAVFREALVLDGKKLPKNLVIEGIHAAGKEIPVEWQPPENHPASLPLVQMNDVQGVQLRGFRLEGKGRQEALLSVSGYCPGLKLTDLHLSGFKNYGLRLRDCTGEREEALALTRLRFTTPKVLKGEAAVVFEGNSEIQETAITDCRFEGPIEAAIRFDTSVAYAKFLRNRFYKVDACFLYRKPQVTGKPRHQLRLDIISNTFLEVFGVLQLQAVPEVQKRENRIIFKNNLLSQTEAFVRLEENLPNPREGLRPLFSSLAANVREGSSCQEGVFFPELTAREFAALPFDPDKDQEFLRYPKSSPLSKQGTENGPVGVPPSD